MQFYSLTTGEKYFDIGKPKDLFVFLFIHYERVHLWLTSSSSTVAFVTVIEEMGRENGTVVSQVQRIVQEVTVALFNEHMEDTTSAPKSSEFSRSSVLIQYPESQVI